MHLAASGGSLKIFQALMMYGVSIDGKNARNHEVIDLATNKEIIELIRAHKSTTECAKCGKTFNDMLTKHWCSTCKKFYCTDNYKIEWTWETHESTERERLDGKCITCWDNIKKHSNKKKN